LTAVGSEPAPAAVPLISLEKNIFRDFHYAAEISEERLQKLSVGIVALSRSVSAL
jgi:hypothetical protein